MGTACPLPALVLAALRAKILRKAGIYFPLAHNHGYYLAGSFPAAGRSRDQKTPITTADTQRKFDEEAPRPWPRRVPRGPHAAVHGRPHRILCLGCPGERPGRRWQCEGHGALLG